MSENNKKLKLPLYLLVLDSIGAILVGLGLAEWIAKTNLVPEPFQFNNYYIAMVIVGGLLMLPALGYLLKSVLGRSPRKV